MADDVTANPGVGGATFAADDIGGVHYPRTKITLGEDSVNGGDVSSSNPMPVRLDAASLAALESVTVAGTVDLGATDNAVLDAIAASVAAIDTDTSTIIGHVDGIEALLGTIDADTGAIMTAVQTLDNAISGNEMQVDVLTMPTVTVNAHAVTNTGTFATQVDGSALTALQLIDNIVSVEDAVAGSGFSGVAMLAVRQDSHSDLAADGDFMAPTIDADGGLRVSIVAGAGSGGTASTDDADFTAATTSGTPIMGVYQTSVDVVTTGDMGIVLIDASRRLVIAPGSADVVDDAAFTPGSTTVVMVGFEFDDNTPDSVNEGDGGAARMSANRNIYTTLRDAAGNERGANINASNQLAIAGPVTIASAGVASGAIASGAIASGAVASGAFASGALASGSIAAGAIADLIVDDAAFTPAASRVFMGGFEADETATDSVDEGDAGAARMTLDRKQIVTNYPHTAGGLATFMASGSDGYSVLGAAAQGVKASAGQIYGYFLYNPNATAHFVHVYDVAAGSVTVGTTVPKFTITVPATSGANLALPYGIAFGTAISCSATSAAATNGAPAVGLDAVFWYA